MCSDGPAEKPCETNMPRREIPRDDWVAFFDNFSRQHYGWLSTVEVREAEIGAQIEWLEKALMALPPI